jgi:hypothetical protein
MRNPVRPSTTAPRDEATRRTVAQSGNSYGTTSRSRLQDGHPLPAFVGAGKVNPVSSEVLAKILRRVSRPMGTRTAVPGDVLFSAFAGLLLMRIGSAGPTFVRRPSDVRYQ